MRFSITAIIFATCLCVSTVTAGISISQSIDKAEIAFTDTVTFEILLVWDGPQFGYRFDRPLDPQFTSLKVVGFTSAISSQGIGADEVTTKRFSYRLIPTLSGIGRVDPVQIGYVTAPDSIPGELLTEMMTLAIAKPVAKSEEGSSAAWFVFIGCLVLLIGFILYNRTVVDDTPVLSPKERFLTELSEIKRESGNDMKKFQYQLHAALAELTRTYCSVNPDGMDMETLKEKLNSTNLSADAADKIAGWIVRAERDKYQPIQTAPGDTIRLESEIRALIEKF